MFEVVLHEPEIPPNTGNIIRLCANSGCRLHLVEPLGFTLDDARLRRAGLDYHEYAGVIVHPDLTTCLTLLETSLDETSLDTQAAGDQATGNGHALGAREKAVQGSEGNFERHPGDRDHLLAPDGGLDGGLGVQGMRRVFAFSTRGAKRHDQISWQAGDVMLFGAETRGLPDHILTAVAERRRVRLPMRPHNRSLNLSNAVAVAVFEAWRQLDFSGGG